MKTRARFQPLMGALLGFWLVPALSHAQINQPPTAFPITVDGFFTNANEWSDVTPVIFNGPNGPAFTYTTVDPGKIALCLFYDDPGSVFNYMGALSGPIEFNVGDGPTQQHFQVFFTSSGINVWRSVGGGDPAPFNHVTPGTDPDLLIGRRSYGTSPNSVYPHNMHELCVLIDCSDPTLNCTPNPGVYSPAPSHWGATVSNGPANPHCVAADTACAQEVPVTVPCDQEGALTVFGDPVSNACVEILPGTGGETRIIKVPLPGETTAVEGPTDRFTPVIAYPNPFESATGVSFSLAEAKNVNVRTYDVAGHLVRTLHSGHMVAGVHYVPWDGRDSRGLHAKAGIYFLRVEVGGRIQSTKVVRMQ